MPISITKGVNFNSSGSVVFNNEIIFNNDVFFKKSFIIPNVSGTIDGSVWFF